MKFILRFLAILALATMAAPAVAQEDNTVSTAELFSSMISGNASAGNATDFQNAAPRPEWGNPIFSEQMITVTLGAVILQRQHDNDSLLPLNASPTTLPSPPATRPSGFPPWHLARTNSQAWTSPPAAASTPPPARSFMGRPSKQL